MYYLIISKKLLSYIYNLINNYVLLLYYLYFNKNCNNINYTYIYIYINYYIINLFFTEETEKASTQCVATCSITNEKVEEEMTNKEENSKYFYNIYDVIITYYCISKMYLKNIKIYCICIDLY